MYVTVYITLSYNSITITIHIPDTVQALTKYLSDTLWASSMHLDTSAHLATQTL